MLSSATPEPQPAPWAPLGAALLSGVTALVAQLVWIRALGRAVGTTTESLAAIAAVFLAGVGLGAAWGGRLAARTPRPGPAAARALLAAGTLVLLSPWLFHVLPDLHLGLLDLLGLEPGPSPWPALLLALPLLLVPTTLLGMTFPLLVAARRSGAGGTATGVGALYALNTLGAALGVLACVLALPLLGERLTLAGAAALEIVAAAWLWRVEDTGVTALPTPPSVAQGASARTRVCLALTGLAGLAVEVAGFRLLEPLSGPHLWGVALLLVPVLAGIAGGAAWGGRLARRSADVSRALAGTLVLAGVFALSALPLAGLWPAVMLVHGEASGGARVLLLLLGSGLALAPTMATLGACFPLAVRAAVETGAQAPRASGDLGAWNSLGSVVGSLLAGFVLVPGLGAAQALLLVAGLPLALGPLWLLSSPGPRRALPALVAALPLFALCVPALRTRLADTAPDLPQVVAVVGGRPPLVRRSDGSTLRLALEGPTDARLYAEWFGGRPASPPGAGTPFAPREGRMGTVALLEEPGGHVRLRVNGLSEAQLDPERPDRGSVTEVALGLLPCLTHRAPKQALVIGHGAGWTAEAVLATDVEHVDVAELDATVLATVEAWRGHPLAAAHDPRARLWLTDGRLLLRRAARADGRRYDVIASQPSHPWVPGAGHLFTREAYELARGALTPDGVFAQWINLFEMSPPLLASALGTFRSVFPRCWLFLFRGEAVLLGFASAPDVDPARWERLLGTTERVRALAGPLGLGRPGDLWRRFMLDEDGIGRFAPAASTAIAEDDRPALELGLAWRVLTAADLGAQLAGREVDLGALLQREFPPDFARALPANEARERWTEQAISSLLLVGERAHADRWDGAARWGSTGEARLTRAALARARGDDLLAERLLREAVAESPERGDWTAGWIGILVPGVLGRPELAERALREAGEAAARHPDHGPVQAALAGLREVCGDALGARQAYEAALAARQPPAEPGTGAALARLLLVSDPGAPLQAPQGPEVGTEMHALALLRGDPGVAADLQALELLTRLEARVGDDASLADAEGLLAARRALEGRAARRTAWGWLLSLDGAGLGDAQLATELEPQSAEGWELCALAHLQRARATHEQAERVANEQGALQALGEALRLAPDPTRMERRARTYLRWFGVSAEGLAPASGE